MVLHCCIGVVDGNLPVDGVAGLPGGPEQHLQVHQIVDDDGELPLVAVVVPRTDALYLLVVAGYQRPGALQHYIFVGTFAGQLIGFAEAVVHHETEVVGAFVPFGFFYHPGVADGLLTPEVIVRVGIHLPQ